MNKLDAFVNTRAKRNVLLLLIVYFLMSLICVLHVYLGLVVLKADNYDQIFDLLNNPIVSFAFLGRMAVDFMSLTSFHLIEVVQRFISSLYLYEIIFFILSSLVIFLKPVTRLEKNVRKMTLLNWCLYLISAALLVIVTILAFKAGSLFDAFALLHLFAWLLIIIHGFLLVLNVYAFCLTLFVEMPDALAYTAIEELI